DQALVLGAGLPAAWVATEHGVSVKRLPTHHGVLDLSVRAESADAVRVRVSGDLDVPPGGLVVTSPLARPLRKVTVNGRSLAAHAADSAVVREFPADALLQYLVEYVVTGSVIDDVRCGCCNCAWRVGPAAGRFAG